MKNNCFSNIENINESLQSRTSKAWECLYQECFKKVKAHLNKSNVGKEEIENIFQECILKLWDSILQKKRDFSNKNSDYYFAVLFRCSTNTFIDGYRRQKRFSEIAEMLQYEGQKITEEDEVWYKQLEDAILKNKAKIISEKEMIAFRMDIEGYSNEEIAKELGLSNKRSATNLKALAVRKIREFLKKFI